MMIDKDTKLYFSVASKAGNFGANLYNAAFSYYGINAVYKPLTVDPGTNIRETTSVFCDLVRGLKAMNASGLSVSMPFKREVATYDWHNHQASIIQTIGNGNTMVFHNKTHDCHNTDWIGFYRSCKTLLDECNYVMIYGTGAASDSIVYALEQIGKPYFFVNRINFNYLKDRFYLSNHGKDVSGGRMLINATPIGMDDVPDHVFTEEVLENFDYVFDVVVKPETNLIKLAKAMNKKYVCGWQMSKEQLREQFKLYTSMNFPEAVMSRKMAEMGYY